MTSQFEPMSEEIELLATKVIDAAIKIHKRLGPGLLESVYEKCMACELRKPGLKVETQIVLPFYYDYMKIDEGSRLDMLVEDEMIVEFKAVEKLDPVHKVQVLTYLKLSGKRLGLLLNFNVPLMKEGIHRIIR